VERSRRCANRLREDLDSLDLAGRARVLVGDAARSVRRLAASGERFDLVLLDPPYASRELPRALAALVEGGVLEPGAMLVAESGGCHAVPVPRGLRQLDERRYGQTRIVRYVADAGDPRHGGSPTA
jgi:16S rRNA G966 N2-methylase RsmD